VHPTLDKRAVDVDLFEDLPIGMVETVAKRLQHEAVEEAISGLVLAAHPPPARVAGRTCVELTLRVGMAEAHP
jgi:hypothetical protein